MVPFLVFILYCKNLCTITLPENFHARWTYRPCYCRKHAGCLYLSVFTISVTKSTMLANSHKYVLSIERYLKKKLVGPSHSHLLSSIWDSWERRSLQAERWEHIRQEGSYDKGSYSQGPKILKAMEKLKSISHK